MYRSDSEAAAEFDASAVSVTIDSVETARFGRILAHVTVGDGKKVVVSTSYTTGDTIPSSVEVAKVNRQYTATRPEFSLGVSIIGAVLITLLVACMAIIVALVVYLLSNMRSRNREYASSRY